MSINLEEVEIEEEFNNDDTEYSSQEDIQPDVSPAYRGLIIQHRDWTVQTIVSQIQRGNIDLNPQFQRRNVWSNARRTGLIESLMLGIPVPEIILAEDRHRKYVVIDGKQRLSTLASFFRLDGYDSIWSPAKLTKNLTDDMLHLRGKAFTSFSPNEQSELENASIRCSFISGYSTTDVLYDIFHRLNSNSVALSPQELRQVLNRGEFADYLVDVTNSYNSLHRVMKLKGPDDRLNDAELLLRFILITLFGREYTGNLKKFLDEKMDFVNSNWSKYSDLVKSITKDLMLTLDKLAEVLKAYEHIGRKRNKDQFEIRFNKVLFEVEAFYFMNLLKRDKIIDNQDKFLDRLTEICNDPVFSASIASTTKGLNEYRTRFTIFGSVMQEIWGLKLENPFER